MLLKVEDAGIKLLGASLGIVPCRARFVGRFLAFSTFRADDRGRETGQAHPGGLTWGPHREFFYSKIPSDPP